MWAIMQQILFETFFLRPSLLGNFHSPVAHPAREKLWSKVAHFVNEEIVRGSLVSINENRLGETGLTITVWLFVNTSL